MKRVLACILFLFSAFANASEPKLHSARLGGRSNEIYAEFDTKSSPDDCAVEYPVPTTCPPAPAAPWTVVVYDSLLHPSVFEVVSSVITIPPLGANGLVTLTLRQNVPPDFKRIDVTFNQPDYSHASIEAKRALTAPAPVAKTPTPSITSAKTKDDANVYLSGTFSPAVGSTPDYSTDSKVNWPMKYFGEHQSSTISAAATVQTDDKGTADPDGFYWGVPIQHILKWPGSAQWSIVGMELDKRGNAVNFVSAPSITRSFYHDFYGLDKKRKGLLTVATSVGLDLTAGVEFGNNLRQAFKIANKPGEGAGTFFRGVPSATAYLIIPNVLHLSKISLSSSYTARIPTTDELFLETRNTKSPIPLMTSQTRNWIQNSLQFNITELVGIQIKHQYGALPPAFSFVQNSGSIGLVFAFKKAQPTLSSR
jgi:hypothetical protein